MRFELVEKKIGLTLRIHWRLPFGRKKINSISNIHKPDGKYAFTFWSNKYGV